MKKSKMIRPRPQEHGPLRDREACAFVPRLVPSSHFEAHHRVAENGRVYLTMSISSWSLTQTVGVGNTSRQPLLTHPVGFPDVSDT